jgi:hypothetical protein
MSDKYKLFSSQHHEMMLRDPELKSAMATVSGELQTAVRQDDISINFQYGPSDYDTYQDVTGDASIGSFKAMAHLSLGTEIGEAKLRSKDSVRYRAGHECLAAASYIFAEPEIGVCQSIGFRNDDDGFSFGYKDGDFGIWYIEGGNFNHIKQSDFNVNKVDGNGRPGFNLDPQKLNIYKISYAWHGGLPAYFSVYAGWDEGWILCHVIDEVNTSVETHLENPSIPVMACLQRTAGSGTAKNAYAGSWRAGVLGGITENNLSNRRFDYSSFNIALPSNTRTSLIFLKSKDLFQGKKNHVKYESLFLELNTDGNKSVLFESWNVSDGTLSAPVTWIDRQTDLSVMQYSLQNLEFTPDPALLFPPRVSTLLGRIDNRRDDIRDQGFFMFPGDEILLTAISSGASEIGFALRTFEYF